MGRVISIFQQQFDKNNYTMYAALFRIFLSFHVLKKIFFNWGSNSFFFEYSMKESERWVYKLSFLGQEVMGMPLLLLGLVVFSILWMFGIGRNLSAIMVFVLMYIYNDTFLEIGNGGDNLLFFILLYMIFIDSYRYFSLQKSKDNPYFNFVSNLAVYSIMAHLCLVYFISGIHKVHADEWFNGVATYYIWNMERFKSPLNDVFSRNAFIIAASTYITLFFEIFFPALIWFKQTKVPMLVLGILLHLGIYFTMMIYDFEILFIFIYGFFISNAAWEKIVAKVEFRMRGLSGKLVKS